MIMKYLKLSQRRRGRLGQFRGLAQLCRGRPAPARAALLARPGLGRLRADGRQAHAGHLDLLGPGDVAQPLQLVLGYLLALVFLGLLERVVRVVRRALVLHQPVLRLLSLGLLVAVTWNPVLHHVVPHLEHKQGLLLKYI